MMAADFAVVTLSSGVAIFLILWGLSLCIESTVRKNNDD